MAPRWRTQKCWCSIYFGLIAGSEMPRSLRGSSLLLPHDTMLRSDPTESRLSPLSPGVTRVLNIRGSGLFSPVHNRMLCLLCVCSSHLLAVILLCITTTIYFVFLFPLNNSTAGISINPPLMYSFFFSCLQ